MNDTPKRQNIVLTDEEKKRLVAYFNVLIEMDFELRKRNENGLNNEEIEIPGL